LGLVCHARDHDATAVGGGPPGRRRHIVEQRRERLPAPHIAKGRGLSLPAKAEPAGPGRSRTRMLTGELALTIAAVFTGAAIYINIAEQPARLQLNNRSLLAEWKLAYRRGYMMQASLAIVGGLFGLVAYLSTLDWRWLLGAIVLLANWPYTIYVIMPTNRLVMDTPTEAATAETRRMLERWGTLHAGRSALGLVATLIFLWAQR